jgi:cytochrome c oxidase cbb3-type subunit 3
MAHEEDRAFAAQYDGIQEYDNALPKWWLQLLYGTIIFAVGYVYYYHFGGPGKGQEELLALDMQQAEARKASAPKMADSSEGTLLGLVSDAEAIGRGKVVFGEKCAVCHGAEGQGMIGPNLVDKYWIHGGDLLAIRKVIAKGVVEKGMLAWESMLPSADIDKVSAYVYSIRGTTPPNPKAPQGDPIE